MGKYAIILVSALIFSVISYSHALQNALFSSNARTVQTFSENQAYNIAQSAATIVINHLRNNIAGSFQAEKDDIFAFPSLEGFHDWEEMHGAYNIIVSNYGDTLYTVQSTGRFEDTIYRTDIGLIPFSPVWNPVIDQAVHAEENITLTGSAIIGGHATINSILTNAVHLGSSTRIDSSLFIGPGGNPDHVVNNKNRVGGEIYVLPKKLEYPLPIFPNFPPFALPGESIYTTRTITPSNYEHRYIPEIHLSGNAQLTIDTEGQDRILHVGVFNIQSGDVHIIGGGSIDIYVEMTVDMAGNSSVNKNGNINDLFMYYRGIDDVDLANDIDFGGTTLFNGTFVSEKARVILRGTGGIQGNVITGGSNILIRGNAEAISRLIYAPYAYVELEGTARIRGAVISDRFYAQGNARITYDPDFDADLPIMEGQGLDFSILYWN